VVIESKRDLIEWRKSLKGRLVVTNGCFDILHAGHVHNLKKARLFGDFLLVGLNSDRSVRLLKGPNRPLNNQSDRAFVLSALSDVSAVFIFNEKRAVKFIDISKPDIYVKGGDYTIHTMDRHEKTAVMKHGGKIFFMPLVSGKSTTNLIEKAQSLPFLSP
jgi:rfaE bifunctional protein nucleotidyltransferase chain/domain